jgi:hypothetical protein
MEAGEVGIMAINLSSTLFQQLDDSQTRRFAQVVDSFARAMFTHRHVFSRILVISAARVELTTSVFSNA